jgi:hypothetical protein
MARGRCSDDFSRGACNLILARRAARHLRQGEALRACDARVEIVKLVPGKSTTNLVKKMAENKASAAAES